MKSHLLLRNPSGTHNRFNQQRGFEREEEDELKEEPANYEPQKRKLSDAWRSYTRDRDNRHRARSIPVPHHIDYIIIDFFVVFTDNHPYYTKRKFARDFGLVPVRYTNHNQTVHFAIQNEQLFREFVRLLHAFFNSPSKLNPVGQEYAIITLIYDFSLLTTPRILQWTGEDIICCLVENPPELSNIQRNIYHTLLNYLRSEGAEVHPVDNEAGWPRLISVSNLSEMLRERIAANFDILYSIQSLRVIVVRPNEYGTPALDWNFRILPPAIREGHQEVVIGIIDTGVRPIAPLVDILRTDDLDTTSTPPNAQRALSPHGTYVAALAAVGQRLFDNLEQEIIADAAIMPIKVMETESGTLDFFAIRNKILAACQRGVRIFNLSVCGRAKNYNTAISTMAALLDELAYRNDLLIFIATGNLANTDIEAIQQELLAGNETAFHSYPNHFYHPYRSSDAHVCEATNLCEPADSFNNVTVGAIAENYLPDTTSDLTPFKELPAFYTRKHPVDYSKKINGVHLRQTQKNQNIRKPDLVMPGGDVLGEEGTMQVPGFGDQGNNFFLRTSGTSLAAPLAANLAAQILGKYPTINMQSVKALMINSATPLLPGEFLGPLVDKVKEEIAQDWYAQDFSSLSKQQKKRVSAVVKQDELYQRLVGYGTPDSEKARFSDDRRVSLLIEDTIPINTHQVVLLNLPAFLHLHPTNGSLAVLEATLCFSVKPNANNQQGYNPLHISFNFIKSLSTDRPSETASIVANKDHPFNREITRGIQAADERHKEISRSQAVKSNRETWSEDFFPNATKPFSNTQRKSLNLRVADLTNIRDQLAIVVRCTGKKDVDAATGHWLKGTEHPFSIAITIEIKDHPAFAGFDLHNELMAINQVDLLGEITGEAEVDIEADAE